VTKVKDTVLPLQEVGGGGTRTARTPFTWRLWPQPGRYRTLLDCAVITSALCHSAPLGCWCWRIIHTSG